MISGGSDAYRGPQVRRVRDVIMGSGNIFIAPGKLIHTPDDVVERPKLTVVRVSRYLKVQSLFRRFVKAERLMIHQDRG